MSINKTHQSSFSKFVYNLIYPAFLGSILYTLLPIQYTNSYKIRVGIFIFFIFDYIHLYFRMDNKFSQRQKNKWHYILFDLFVSILLFIAYQYITNPILGIFLFALVPLCFLAYSIPLKYNVRFYLIFSILTLIYAGVFITNFNSSEGFINVKDDIALLNMIRVMSSIYIVYVIFELSRKRTIKKLPNNT